MPNTDVNLKLKQGFQNGNGWINVTAPNTGQQYAFKYTGGWQDQGGMKSKIGDGTAILNVSLDQDNRYSVNNLTFKNDDTPPQLSGAFTSTSASITDLNTMQLNADYCVMVYDSTNGSQIPCDPMIANDPKNPLPNMAPRIQHQ